MNRLVAPFPWFGGKSIAADLIWSRIGNVPNYVEPFAGSLAVLLGRPHEPRIETVNDLDCYLANFWRALQADAEAVAQYADWPVNEADLHARHLWLINQQEFQERMKTDPDYFDCKIAGWWVWGIAQWIGSGWCAKRPHLGNAGVGVNRKLLHLGDAGVGVNRQLPHLSGSRGVNRLYLQLLSYFETLADRLRKVRVCCGDWTRVLGPSPTEKLGVTGILLDPPYSEEANRDEHVNNFYDSKVASEVRQWAISNGDNPQLRIALCGYEGEHEMPGSWECVPWKARGGYGSQGNGNGRLNSARERIWFSPHCLTAPLFESLRLQELTLEST